MTDKAKKVPLATLSTPSTAFTSDAQLVSDGGSAVLSFDFDRDGLLLHSGVRFNRTWASRWRAESLCTAWHIEDAYDTIVEIAESPWLGELVAARSSSSREERTVRHFMLYVDSSGCFEFAAESFELLPEEPVS